MSENSFFKRLIGRLSSFTKGIIVGAVITFFLTTAIGISGAFDFLSEKVNQGKEAVDSLLDETFLGYTAADFDEILLGEASQHQELVIMELPLSLSTTITKAGLADLQIFSKTKVITYHATGVYIVDISDLKSEDIVVDNELKTVTINVRHAQLQYVQPNWDATEFMDTEKGLLAFGDLALTQEQQNDLQKSILEEMKKEFNSAANLAQADEFAKLHLWQLFQPLISSITNSYLVEINFTD